MSADQSCLFPHRWYPQRTAPQLYFVAIRVPEFELHGTVAFQGVFHLLIHKPSPSAWMTPTSG
jgi:hypothetical protein